MVLRVLDRAARIPAVDEVVAAIPDIAQDDELASLLAVAGVRTLRGPADDVLHRYQLAAEQTSADIVVRITADCPLLSPRVSGLVLAAFNESSWDYASNTLERTWPRGLDTEVFSRDVLERIDREATTADEREHVTPAIWRHPDRFRLRAVHGTTDLSALRWTVDEVDDLRLVEAIYQALARSSEDFDITEILELLDRRPTIARINEQVTQKDLGH
jgi:spore coat polysaccharide biosynthesis protein SpsF